MVVYWLRLSEQSRNVTSSSFWKRASAEKGGDQLTPGRIAEYYDIVSNNLPIPDEYTPTERRLLNEYARQSFLIVGPIPKRLQEPKAPPEGVLAEPPAPPATIPTEPFVPPTAVPAPSPSPPISPAPPVEAPKPVAPPPEPVPESTPEPEPPSEPAEDDSAAVKEHFERKRSPSIHERREAPYMPEGPGDEPEKPPHNVPIGDPPRWSTPTVRLSDEDRNQVLQYYARTGQSSPGNGVSFDKETFNPLRDYAMRDETFVGVRTALLDPRSTVSSYQPEEELAVPEAEEPRPRSRLPSAAAIMTFFCMVGAGAFLLPEFAGKDPPYSWLAPVLLFLAAIFAVLALAAAIREASR